MVAAEPKSVEIVRRVANVIGPVASIDPRRQEDVDFVIVAARNFQCHGGIMDDRDQSGPGRESIKCAYDTFQMPA